MASKHEREKIVCVAKNGFESTTHTKCSAKNFNYKRRSEYDEDQPSTIMPALTPAPNLKKEPAVVKEKPETISGKTITIAPHTQIQPQPQKTLAPIRPNVSIPIIQKQQTNTNGVKANTMPSLPFPLLILNGMPQQIQQNSQEKKTGNNGVTTTICGLNTANKPNNDVNTLLKELVSVQKESLEIQKQRLEVEKQKLEFERVVGTQLLSLVPMFGTIMQRINLNSEDSFENEDEEQKITKNGRKRKHDSEIEFLKDSKILRNILEHGIKKYISSKTCENDSSENEDKYEDSD